MTGTKLQNTQEVQHAPAAATALNADMIDALHVRDTESLSYSAPNVSLDQVGTTPGAANPSVCGLDIHSAIPSSNFAAGVFVDGVHRYR